MPPHRDDLAKEHGKTQYPTFLPAAATCLLYDKSLSRDDRVNSALLLYGDEDANEPLGSVRKTEVSTLLKDSAWEPGVLIGLNQKSYGLGKHQPMVLAPATATALEYPHVINDGFCPCPQEIYTRMSLNFRIVREDVRTALCMKPVTR